MAYQTPPYESSTASRSGDDYVERAERRELLARYVLPTLLAITILSIGYWLGWASGRNNLLEGTYVHKGVMIDHLGNPETPPTRMTP